MKKLYVLIYSLLLFSPHSVFAQNHSIKPYGNSGVEINGLAYGNKLECEKPFNAYIAHEHCAAQKPTIDVAILSSVSVAEIKKKGHKILGCFKATMGFLYPIERPHTIKLCGKSKFVRYKVFDKNGAMFFEKTTPIIYLPPE